MKSSNPVPKTQPKLCASCPASIFFYNRKGNANIAMQGFQQDRILTLIDGVPYYETKYGYLDLSSIPSSMISRIEVIKGASSVLYGPNAEGGVINIITKKGGDQPSLSLRGEMGDYGTNREVISGGGQKRHSELLGHVRA